MNPRFFVFHGLTIASAALVTSWLLLLGWACLLVGAAWDDS